MNMLPVKTRQSAPLHTRTDLRAQAGLDIAAALTTLLADMLALYMKTKNFHWHMTGRHFRDYHVLLDKQAKQLYQMTDEIAERARKIGGTTLRSIGDISRHQRIKDNDEEFLTPDQMMTVLRDDNRQFTRHLRAAHQICQKHNDVATASLIENWIDESENRTWYLAEIVTTVT